jgi:putative ABC transport system permease protein
VTAKIVLENLKHKPMRSLLSILLVGVPVTLILCLVGLSHGMLEDTQRRTRAVGADIIFRPQGSSLLSTGGAMPEGIVKALEKRPHVAMAVGVLNALVGGVDLWAAGLDLDAFTRFSGGFKVQDGTVFQQPDDVMIDQYYASEKNVHVGGYVTFLNKRWRVCGIFQGGVLSHIVFPLGVLQDVTEHAGQVTQIYLKLDNPSNTRDVIGSLKSDPAWGEYKVYSTEEFTALFSINNIPGLKEFVWVIVSIGVVIGFAVVCLSMYMAVLQRTREIGILKSLGASNAFILRIVLAEALIMGVGGTALGIVMSFGAWWLIRTLLPASIPMVIVPEWWLIALAITLFGAGLGALYPGLAAARHDPIEALAYE